MGLCHSTKQCKPQNQLCDLTMSQQMLENLQKVIEMQQEKPQNNGTQSENDFMAMDEIPTNSKQKTIIQPLQHKLIRHVNSLQHHTENQKRYIFVFDRLYSQQRKVPILFPLEQSTIMKKRKQTQQE